MTNKPPLGAQSSRAAIAVVTELPLGHSCLMLAGLPSTTCSQRIVRESTQ